MAGNAYDEVYRAPVAPPWDLGAPQPALARMLAEGRVRGPRVLDVGCGPGDLAIALACHGFDVTAVDVSPVAIDIARTRAANAGVAVHFEVQDATALSLAAAPFDSVFDSGLLHSLLRVGEAEADRYLALLPGLAAPGATVFVLAMSVTAAQGWGVTEAYLREKFAEPQWTDTEVDDIEIAADLKPGSLSLAGFLVRTLRAG
ncbi:MAG: methyltransferase domain-containing protein [Hamadaea sp.]|nr:methyltransferase domain-containing protein [Hamadaea sp.]NUT07342.1 methyltransferase domain-containing protein [Hamadaea sp.]